MSCRAYAKRRGVNPNAVSAAITAGRLKACIVRDQWGQPKIGDPDLADREWAANSDASMIRGNPQAADVAAAVAARVASDTKRRLPDEEDAFPDQATSKAQALFWDAQLKELKFREAAGELVAMAKVGDAVENAFAECKTKLLGLISRMRQEDPSFTPEQLARVDAWMREALAALVIEEPE